MHTLIITGSDTGIGKTRVTGLLAAWLPRPGESVQIVKPVETGVSVAGDGDAARAALQARELRGEKIRIETHTLCRFPEPLAPLAAAKRAGTVLDADTLLAGIHRLPACDWRLIEGAGGLAVPLDQDGRDWADFAVALPEAHLVLVVPDRLGSVNQARLAVAYAHGKGLKGSLWLNENVPAEPAVREANREGVAGIKEWPLFRLGYACDTPVDAGRTAAWYRSLPPAEPVVAAGRNNGSGN